MGHGMLEALKTADWRQDFLHSFGNDTKIDLYVDKNESKYSIRKRLSNKNI